MCIFQNPAYAPHSGNVNDDYMLDIFNNLRGLNRVVSVSLGKKFLKSDNIKIVVARNLLGFKEEENESQIL